MSSIEINCFTRTGMLRQIKSRLYELICLETEKKVLLAECPEEYKNAKIQYCNSFSRYINVKQKSIEYKNTASYIVSNGEKIRIKSTEHIRIQLILDRLSEIKSCIESLRKTVKLYCHNVNSTKGAGDSSIDYKTLKAAAESEFRTANEQIHIFDRTAFYQESNFHAAFNEKHYASIKNSVNLNNTFSNYYVCPRNEIYRSKNEVLSSLCLMHCGLSYCVEPLYPNSGMRADFGMLSSFHQKRDGTIVTLKKPKMIFIEIAGLRNNDDYNAKLNKKIEFARMSKIPLVVIDFTEYNKAESTAVFNFEILCDIFTELYFGIRKADGVILTPY